MIITSILSLKNFFERYQTLAILLVLGFLLLIVYYIKTYFPKLFDNNEGLKTQDELDKEELDNLIQTQKIEEVVVEEEEEEETFFINDNNRDKINKIKNKK